MASGTRQYNAIIATPFGPLGIATDSGSVRGTEYLSPRRSPRAPTDAFSREVCRQVRAYLDEPGFRFSVPVAVEGTDFQLRVWAALQGIRAGRPLTYGELARRLRSSARAIGGACRRNPVPLIIPCHRVVAASGAGGFMGATDGRPLAIKNWLLAHEQGG
ncbi:MAG: methylated-DNA--[protein]-cysteine S-methyltransferase [Gammaproteobacteria bacterium]|jgi:methylated-DNA-[protein]-cysteine S-methyltransferase|nr:methylated-DNA--[protein]-cysteine S-methyltransferase [Gammaproteobacteria bacterium]